MGRKRQRSRAAPTDDDERPVGTVDESKSVQDPDSKSQTDDSELTEERKKELDVWDAFKEEHHEVLEQLPLSLHRQFKLMRELDSQGQVFQADLLTSIRRYICLRESLATRNVEDDARRAEGARPNAMDVDDSGVDQGGDAKSPTVLQVDFAEPSHGKATVDGDLRAGSANASPAVAYQSKPGETTRTLLQCIAQTSEEAIRTAEEKVSIAQTAYETVDRHIRLLDQAIKEQEAAISLGVRPGTHLAPILLPDLVVPRWARPPRVEHSPVPSLSPEPELYAQGLPTLEQPPPQVPSPKAPKKGKKAVPPKSTKPEKEEVQTPIVAGSEEPLVTPRTRRIGVRLTIPAQPQPPGPSVPADPNEPRYCYCNQVSYGTMIGCDNKGCKLEWFHLGCTGLSGVPTEKKWYCRECKPKMTQKGRSKT